MTRKDDERLQRRVEQRLASRGLRAPCRIQVSVNKGVVTLTGQVQYDYQKRAAVKAIQTLDGIQSVIEQLQVAPPKRAWEE